MAFSKKQLQILAFPNSDYTALICDGAIRTGKTSIMAVAFLMWAMRDFNGVNFGICSKTLQTADRNIIKPLLAMTYVKERFIIKYHTYSYMEVTAFGHTNIFYMYGGRDASSYRLIQGITLAGVFLDEVALMPRSFVEQALARCSIAGRRFWFNCNPEGQMHWFNQEWVLHPEEHNALHLHFTLDDNPALPEQIKIDYENMYSGLFKDRYIHGLWVNAEGLIYDAFKKDVHVLNANEISCLDLEDRPIVSSDFGIQNATVFLYWRKIKGKNSWVCIDEYYYSGREEHKQKSVKELIEGLKALCVRNTAEPYKELHEVEYENPKIVIIDPSASALIVEARKNGFKCKEADNDVVNGIADVQKMLNEERLFFSGKCKHLIEEFGMYVWDEKASERGEDKPVKDHDHCLDALRYHVYTLKLARKAKEDTIPRNLMFL